MGKSKNAGKSNPMFGKKHPPEVLEKMRLAHIGKKRPRFRSGKRPDLFVSNHKRYREMIHYYIQKIRSDRRTDGG
jgi:hypothetical protein